MNTKQVYHYVYRITNIVEKRHYYGKRSTSIDPKLDLGVKYFSSSKDKAFIADQKSDPKNYKYKVIRIYETDKEALAAEIKLHNKFEVGINPNFYNRAKQTSIGFSITGRNHSKETKEKISVTRKGKNHSKETKEKISAANKGNTNSKGKSPSKETREKLSIAHKGKKGKPHSKETKEKMSIALKGTNHPQAKLANIYCRYTNDLIAENIVISVWAKANGYHRANLCATARADKSKPSSTTNPHYHKGVYVVYV